MIHRHLTVPRSGRLAKAGISIIVLGAGAFLWTMAVLVSHESELQCDAIRCAHIERTRSGLFNGTIWRG